MAEQLNVKCTQICHNEPGKGKCKCDREIALGKKRMKAYCNCGNDITTAAQLQKALLFNCVDENFQVAVMKLPEIKSTLAGTTKIAQITNYKCFQFDGNSVKLNRFFDVGQGKILTLGNASYVCRSTLVVGFLSNHRMQIQQIHSRGPDLRGFLEIFYCPESQCTCSFSSAVELNEHVTSLNHVYPQKMYGADKIKLQFEARMKGISKQVILF